MTHHVYVETVEGLVIIIKGRPIHLARSHALFNRALAALQGGTDEVEAIVDCVKREIEAQCRVTPNLEYKGGSILYMGQPVHGYAVERLVELVTSGGDAKPVANFLEKLQLNPSAQTVENLYQFLEHGGMKIAESGNFMAYKAVRQDFRDIHSGQFDNSIGQTLSMPRRNVDDRRENTCSYGFHVCSFDYLKHFAQSNGHIMICEVNPADVVSIPHDYHNTKMRVCCYHVIGEHEGYKDREGADILRNYELGGSFEVWTCVRDQDECNDKIWSLGDDNSFADIATAVKAANDWLGLYDDFGGNTIIGCKVIHNDVVMYRIGEH